MADGLERQASGRGAVHEGRRVAIVGAGIIGSSWALVFARAGWEVRVFARHAAVREVAARARAPRGGGGAGHCP